MKYTKLLFAFSMLLIILPTRNIYASCSSEGYTVVTINGILTDKNGAVNNALALKQKLKPFNNQPIKVDYLYNPTHLAGANDFIDVIQQGLFGQKSDYDLVEMLNDASEKVKTQKLLLVAHSQGNFYANNFYDKTASQPGGIPSQSLGVYGVGSPANRVAGGGKYLTSDTDSVIAATAARYFNILKPNVHIPLKPADGNGHGFAEVYLKYKGDKIVSDIKSSLGKLTENEEQSPDAPCISPPELTALHKIQGAVLSIADPAALAVKNGAVVSYKVGVYIRDKTAKAGLAMGNVINKIARNLVANVADSMPDDAPNLPTILSVAPSEASAEEHVVPQETEKPEVPNEDIAYLTETINEDESSLEETSEKKKHRSGGGGSADNSESAPPAETPEPEPTPAEDPAVEPAPDPTEEPEPDPVPEPEPDPEPEPLPEPEPIPEPEPDPVVSNTIYSQPDSSVEISSPIVSFDTFTGKSGHIQSIQFAYNDAGNSIGKFIGVSVVDRTEGINYYGTDEGNSCGNTYESTGSNEKVIVELDSATHYKAYPCTGPDLVLDPTHVYGIALYPNTNNFVGDIKFYGKSGVNDDVYLEITDDSMPSAGKVIKSLKFPDLGATGVIDEVSHQIEISVPFGTDITALEPVIRISGGASVRPASGEPQDFTDPVSYEVTAENGETEIYEAVVSVRPNVVYSQPDNSVEILNGEHITLGSLFTGAQGRITDFKFSYNDKGADETMWVGAQIVDQTNGKSYYAWKSGFSEHCGDAYQSHRINAPVIAELGNDYEYREYPCTGENLVLDPTHTYGVNLFRNRGGNGSQRFYGSSNTSDDAYLYIESDGTAPGSSDPEPDPLPDASPEITSYTFDGTEGDITVDPTANPVTLSFNASENVDWVSIIIENGSDASMDKQFRSGNNCEDGTSTCEKIWDGTLSGGGDAPEGVYRIKVHIKDTDGNAFQEFLENTITVDSLIISEEDAEEEPAEEEETLVDDSQSNEVP